MTGRRHMGLVAAAATLLATAPLNTIVITGAPTLAHTARAPLWGQFLEGLIGAELTGTEVTADATFGHGC